ncbi:unnamed protein product [Heterobilharzia americana]|nr:unnamed protein product [Heterobilharzia americana]
MTAACRYCGYTTMSNDTRRDLLLGIDNMITELLHAVRLERKIYDHKFSVNDESSKTHEVSKPFLRSLSLKEEKTFAFPTASKATQTVPVTSCVCDLPTDSKQNRDYVLHQTSETSNYAATNITPSSRQSCCLSKAHCCRVDNYGCLTIMCSSHSNPSVSCSCKHYQGRCCSTPKYPNIDLNPSGYTVHNGRISLKKTKSSWNGRYVSSTSGCSTGGCSTGHKHSHNLITSNSPSDELFNYRSDYSCSCRMHTSLRRS